MEASKDEQLSMLMQRDYSIDFSKYFRKGWEILQANFVQIGGFFLVTIGINLAVNLVPVIGQIVSSVINAPLAAGYTFVILAILRGKSFTFNDFFQGLSNKYFLQLFLLSLVGGLLTALGMILLVLPGIYLAVSYLFAIQFAVDWDLEFFQALETSRKFVTKQWLQVFVFMLMLVLLNIAGLIALGIGIFVTAPLSLCIVICVYDDIAGNPDNGAIRGSSGSIRDF
jgi:uncharacterized membrane protein